MIVNYEEKAYETYFNIELGKKCDILFPPGQVLEGSLGFDASFYTNNQNLWRFLGYPCFLFGGLALKEIADEMEYHLGRSINGIPNLKANILFQYKKPEYITSHAGREWKHWQRSYFRYNINREQQSLLMHIHRQFGSKILAIYAAPAATDINDLVNIYAKQELIESSNFKKVSDLNTHHRNTYIKAGTYSIACSEPQSIKNLDLIQELESLSYDNEASKNSKTNNHQFINELRQQIESAVVDNKYYSESFSTLNKSIEFYKKNELLYSFLVMYNFRMLTGTQWLIKL